MRHPNDIKKFVKKNGTYMLKKTKADLKGKAQLDSSTDDKLEVDFSAELDEDSGLEEPIDSSATENKIKLNTVSNGKVTETSQHSDGKKNNSNSKVFHSNVQTANNSAASVTAAAAAAAAQRFLPNFYPYFTAQMAAAAAAAMQPQPAGFFQRPSNTDEVAAAQFLMQLRNNNDPSSIHQLFQADVFNNVTQRTMTPTSVTKHSRPSISTNSNKKQRPNELIMPDVKTYYGSNDDSYSVESINIPQMFGSEQLPLNLSVNSKKRKSKPYIHKKELENFDEFKDAMNDISIKIEN
jgi:hypothetical protein